MTQAGGPGALAAFYQWRPVLQEMLRALDTIGIEFSVPTRVRPGRMSYPRVRRPFPLRGLGPWEPGVTGLSCPDPCGYGELRWPTHNQHWR